MKRKRQFVEEDDFEFPESDEETSDSVETILFPPAPSSFTSSRKTARKERKEKRAERREKTASPTYFLGQHVGMEILQPQMVEDHFVWSDIDVRPSAGRKFGLFATRDLPIYTIIPYLGVVIDSKLPNNQSFLKLVDHEYMVGNDTIIDGSPDLYPYSGPEAPPIGMLGLSIAAFSNEPFEKTEFANSMLIESVIGEHIIPLGFPAIITLFEIKAGDEILTCYNRKRDYSTNCPDMFLVPTTLSQVLANESKQIKAWNAKYADAYYNFPTLRSK